MTDEKKPEPNPLTFFVRGYSGWDWLLNLLPYSWQAKIVARRLMKDHWKGADPDLVPMIVILSTAGPYRILDKSGRVGPAGQTGIPREMLR